MIKLIIIVIITLIIGGLVGFIIGYKRGTYNEQLNHFGIKKNKRIRL